MNYVFPAIFHKNDDDGSYTITYPDLEGCISEGKTLANAMEMAEDALTQWVNYLTDKKQAIPTPSTMQDIKVDNNEFINFVRAEIKDNRAVRRAVSIPKWMDDAATDARLSLSRVLQDALEKRLSSI